MIQPRITIITPTHCTGDSVKNALLSVANQSYNNIEHIFIDGASDDDTIPSIQQYLGIYKHIRLISEPDCGIYDAMNKGLQLCTGDWIYFLGSDDTLYSDTILFDLWNEGFFGKEQVVYGNVIIQGNTPWANDNSIYDGPFCLEKLFKQNICHQSIFYPKSVIDRIGYYKTKYKITSDWDYNLHCWSKYRFVYADRIIAFFKAGGKSSDQGDLSLHYDLPYNVIKYFDIDVNDPKNSEISSIFYYPISRIREDRQVMKIRELEQEIEDLRKTIFASKQQPVINPPSSSQDINSTIHSMTSTFYQQFDEILSIIDQEIPYLDKDQFHRHLDKIPLEIFGQILVERPGEYPNLLKWLPELPSPEVQQSWTGTSGHTLMKQSISFIRIAVSKFHEITGKPIRECKVLDFGCGWGRLIRILYKYLPVGHIYGVDPWDKSIELCRAQGLQCHLGISEYMPTSLPGDCNTTFDLAIVFSVFTHLSEKAARSAMDLLTHMLNKNGILILTFRPREYWSYIQDKSAFFKSIPIDQMLSDHDRSGFAFFPHPRKDIDGDITYGEATMSLSFLQNLCKDLIYCGLEWSQEDPHQVIAVFRKG